MKNSFDTPWRRSFEAFSSLIWIATGVGLATFGAVSGPHYTTAMLVTMTCFGFGFYRAGESVQLWERKLALLPEGNAFISAEGLARIVKKHPDKVWIGRGFRWTMEHTQLAFSLRKLNLTHLKPPYWYSWLRGYRSETDEIGATWIHGIDPNEEDISIPKSHLEGHTFILGTTGSGKTRALETLIAQRIFNGDCVIYIDPKGDRDARKTLQRACILANRPEAFCHFHPAFPESSVRIDPLRNWNRETELASRISALIPSETGSDAFVAFAWRVINLVCQGLIKIDARPNLKMVRRHIEGGPDILLESVITAHFDAAIPNWKSRVKPYMERARTTRKPSALTTNELIAYVYFYKAEGQNEAPSETVSGLISLFEHSRDHAGKMLASLAPVLDMLTSGSLGELLSPDATKIDDPRPIIDSAKVINEGLVLYIGTDGLPDPVVSSIIGSIFLADLCAVAGDRYNYGVNDRKINLFIDEASDCINDPAISLLNKGRGAKFELTLASQTWQDFVAKTGTEAKARKILGNLNNLIALRTKDGSTQEYITETMGKASVMTTMTSQSTNAVVGNRDPTNFSASYGERMVEDNDAELISTDLLGQLPNFHYVASVSGGRIYKGRFPILKSDIDPSLDDMVWKQSAGDLAQMPLEHPEDEHSRAA